MSSPPTDSNTVTHRHGVVAALAGPPANAGLAALAGGLDGRLETSELAALTKLTQVESAPLPNAHSHEPGGHGVFGPVAESALSPADQRVFDAQWTAAATAARGLATPDAATASGYIEVSSQTPGVGTHWLKWSLVDAPFDPANPSMLLFDEAADRPVRLLGFSYWVRAASEPSGFAGTNDHWHGHQGLCFVHGWLQLEGLGSASECGLLAERQRPVDAARVGGRGCTQPLGSPGTDQPRAVPLAPPSPRCAQLRPIELLGQGRQLLMSDWA